jgi:hypothetical protein
MLGKCFWGFRFERMQPEHIQRVTEVASAGIQPARRLSCAFPSSCGIRRAISYVCSLSGFDTGTGIESAPAERLSQGKGRVEFPRVGQPRPANSIRSLAVRLCGRYPSPVARISCLPSAGLLRLCNESWSVLPSNRHSPSSSLTPCTFAADRSRTRSQKWPLLPISLSSLRSQQLAVFLSTKLRRPQISPDAISVTSAT